jgi:hypothetical protein
MHEFTVGHIRDSPQPMPELLRKGCTGIALSNQHLDINEIKINLVVMTATFLQEVDRLACIENHECAFLVHEIGNHIPNNFVFVLPQPCHRDTWVIVDKKLIVLIV